MYQHLTECKTRAENMQISFCFCKTCICLKFLENIQISVNMIDRLNITDEYSVKCDFILNTVDAALIFHSENFENVMFYDFIYLAKVFRMRPKVRSTLRLESRKFKRDCVLYVFSLPLCRITISDVVRSRSHQCNDRQRINSSSTI